MGFTFTLATVLRVRESVEKREERALQTIQAEMARVARDIADLTAAIAKAHDARHEAMRTPIPASHLQSMIEDVQAAAEKKKALLQTLQGLEQQRVDQMKIYQAAHRGREMLTDMQSEQRALYEQGQVRREQKQLDDIFIARRQRS